MAITADDLQITKQLLIERELTKSEKKAVVRYCIAKEERENFTFSDCVDDADKKAFSIMNDPANAFFACTGYETFHKKGCPKLNTIGANMGFSSYNKAKASGFRPCKICKPSPKQNVEVSIPKKSIVRKYETIEDIQRLCKKYGLKWGYDGTYITMNTKSGMWRVDTGARPYILEHINLLVDKSKNKLYHKQPRIFLSLVDVVFYVHWHDHCRKHRPVHSKY